MSLSLDEAEIAACEKLLARDPNDASALERMAAVAFRQQRLDDAADYLNRALAAAPSARLNYYLGGVLEAQVKFAEALAQFDAALAREPNTASVLVSRARMLLALGRGAEAVEAADAALKAAPGHAGAWLAHGQALTLVGRPEAARASFDRAHALAPQMAEEAIKAVDTLIAADRYPEALATVDVALQLKPSARALNQRGAILFHLGRDPESEQAFTAALRLDPSIAEAWWNLGNTLTAMKRGEDALTAFNEALRLKPDLKPALLSRGNQLADFGRTEDALLDFETLLRLDPANAWALGRILPMRRDLVDWRDHDAQLARLEAGVASGRLRIWPFDGLSLFDDPALQLAAPRAHAQSLQKQTPMAGALSDGKIRLGYISGDFHAHAVAHLIAGVFEAHDRERFELIAFATGPETEDAMRARLRAAFDEFIVIPGNATDHAAATMIRDKNIDIAIDLTGFTLNGRTNALSHRPAPVQVNYLGYPGTLGADFIDYLIADPVIIPPELECFYAESVVRLPVCYQPNTPHPAALTPTRAEAGLPEAGIVFCSFNSAFKISPSVFASWMRILKACDGAVLWLFAKPAGAEKLRREAEQAGVAPERLVFADFAAHDKHLGRLALADIVLDSWPYGAHTTASDALFMGVPVVTWTGRAFASRVATSLLKAVGAPELAADSIEAFEALAIALAHDPERLAALKRRLSEARRTAPLFDVPPITRALERAYEEMVARYRAGLPPAPFDVGDGGVQVRMKNAAPPDVTQLVEATARLMAEGRYEEGLASANKALLQAPDNVTALDQLGEILFHADRDTEAEAALRRALALDPLRFSAWSNLGHTLAASGRADEALAAFAEALKLYPNFARALEWRGVVLSDLGRHAEAVHDFEVLHRVAPDHVWASGRLLAARRQVADWRDHAALLAETAAGVANGSRRIWPFEAAYLFDDPELQRSAARARIEELRPRWQMPLAPHQKREGKIRVGYVSADLRTHVTSTLAVGLFEAHDKARFEITAFACGADIDDPMRARLRAAFDRFVIVPPQMRDHDLAALIRSHDIDIAVDLKGFTQDGRTNALAHRPSPVQAQWLGFPGTLGADYIDYVIADPQLIPPTLAHFYDEKIVRLPHAYQPYTRHPMAPAPTRAPAGLPDTGVVFCCFNASYKIAPDVFASWMRILKACGGAVLWLYAQGEAAAHLRAAAAESGVALERLIFAPPVTNDRHLARLSLADIVLDAWPYGAHTTASDALCVGVPVVTWAGRTFASRVATSLLTAVGAPELSADSPEAYEALAISLARDPARLAAIKVKLAAARTSAPLFDITATARALERGFEAMMARYRAGLPPADIDVPGEA